MEAHHVRVVRRAAVQLQLAHGAVDVPTGEGALVNGSRQWYGTVRYDTRWERRGMAWSGIWLGSGCSLEASIYRYRAGIVWYGEDLKDSKQ